MTCMQGNYSIIKKQQLTKTIFDYTVVCPPLAEHAVAGQFAHIRVDSHTLRRPISICKIDRKQGTLRFVFETRGSGTEQLAQLNIGDTMDLMGPLGNGFPLLSKDEKVILIGGGIGAPPMLEIAAHYGGNATVVLGFRNASAVILEADFRALGCDTRLATDDGSAGFHGFVTGLLEQRLAEGSTSVINACGPLGMLKGIVQIAQTHRVPVKVSLEERMGCGIGACLVCACRTVRDGQEIFSHVCKDGPVFDGEEVVFA